MKFTLASQHTQVELAESGELQLGNYTDVIAPSLKLMPPAWWVLLVILAAIGILAWIKVSNINRLQFIVKTIYVTTVKRINRDDFVVWHNTTVAMVSVFVLMTGLLLFYTHEYYNLQLLGSTGLWLYIQLCFFVVILYGIKLMTIRLTAFIFRHELALQEYTRNIVIVNIMLGILLIPVVVGVAYINIEFRAIFLGSAFILVAIFFLLRLFKGLIIGLSSKVSRSYLFLYLCALEILPLVVLIKLFMGNVATLN